MFFLIPATSFAPLACLSDKPPIIEHLLSSNVQKAASFFVQGWELFLSYSRSMFKKITHCQESKDTSSDVVNI